MHLIGARPWRGIAAAVVLLAGTAVAGCDPGPTATGTPSPEATVSASPAGSPAGSPMGSPADDACTADALAVSGGPWSSAAGSRGAEVLVQNQGNSPCTLPAIAQVAVVDAASAPLAQTEPATGADLTLEAGAAARFLLLFGNWCDETADLPLHIVLQAEGAGIQVQGLDLVQADLPPCNAPGDPPLLTAQPWSDG